jgi:hypothetical protein
MASRASNPVARVVAWSFRMAAVAMSVLVVVKSASYHEPVCRYIAEG